MDARRQEGAPVKLNISASSARAAALAAIVARLFIGLTVDSPASFHNGAWVSVLLGGALSVPWLLGVDLLRQRFRACPGPARLLLMSVVLASSTVGAAATLADLTRSSGYLSLDRCHPLALLIPAGLAALWCVWKGGDAIGYGAMVWARLFGTLMLLVALLQLGRYRSQWLLPLLGSGWRDIVRGALQSTGHIMAISGILLLPDDAEAAEIGARRLLRMLVAAVCVAAALILLRLMMTPTMTRGQETWLKRLDSLLVNGRAPLYLQLPMIAAWFGGLLHLLVCECFTAAASFQRLSERLDGRLCAFLTVLASVVLSTTLSPAAGFEGFEAWLAVALPACAALALAAMREKKEA